MPHRQRPPGRPAIAVAPPKQTFRKRFVTLDAERDRLVARLTALGEIVKRHPSHNRALTLLNTSFRRASLAQRGGILQAAEWLIDLMERMGPMV